MATKHKQEEQDNEHKSFHAQVLHGRDDRGVPFRRDFGASRSEAGQGRYERPGAVFAIAAVVDLFGDAFVQNPIVGKSSKNPALGTWNTENLARLPGLKFRGA